jgi:hypothetical protein
MMSRNILDAFQQQLSGCRMADIAETEDADHAFALVDHRQRGVAARNGACAASESNSLACVPVSAAWRYSPQFAAPRRQASYKFFQFAALPLASMICTANPTSTTVTGIPMVKASCPGNIARNNASNIPAAHRNRAIHFRRRSYRCSGFMASRRLY